ncbi:MAG: VCBS repeat-containing protein, partial [Bacteroidales bacterium]|nr:VCBS repeat-containing protein [Bacteroidales bacterium]
YKKYFTEIANFDKILAAGASDNDPNYFILKSKDGKTIYYGNTSNSRIESTSSTYSTKGLFWLINKIENNNGNYAEYEYLERNGTFYPKQIIYTGNASIAPKCSVKFYYIEREDKIFGYIGDGRIEQDLLLYKIETFQNGNKVNTYEFRYNYADDNFSQLSEIVFYNSSMQFYNSTKITWGDESSNEILTKRLNYEPDFRKGYLNIPGDFNGDGKTDLVTIREIDYVMYFWYGNGVSNNPIIFGDIYDFNPEKIYNAVPGDFNGDGFSDLIVVSKEDETKERYKFWFYRIKERTDGTRLEITKFFLFESSDKEIDIGDFNGDGQTDFMYTTDNTIILYSIINNALFVHNSYDIDKLKETYLSDFNGDGKTDIMAISGNSKTCRIYDKDAQFYSSDDWNKNDYIKIGDFNADGKSDVLWWKDEVWKLRFYTGSGFSDAIVANLPYSENDPDDKKNGIFVNDYNGDGKQDVLMFSKNANKADTATFVKMCYFKYDNFSDVVYSETWNNLKPHKNNFITSNDFNGDGRVDVLCWLFEEIGGEFEHVFAICENQTNPELNFVHSITDGFNTVTEIEYKPLTNDDIYTKSKEQDGDVTTYQFPLYVVSKLKTQNGIGGWFEKTYEYENLMIHRKGKGILGFEKFIIKENTSYNIYETVFEYNPTYFNVGIKASYIKRGNSTISETTFNNQIKWYSGKRILPIVKSQTSTDVLKDITKTTIYNYDDYGNPLNIRDYFENGTETIAEYSYANNGSWCNYLVKYEKTTKKRQGQENYIRQTDYEYYSNGNLFKIINDEDKPDFTITSTYKDYNQFGQAHTLEVTNLGITKTSTYQFDNYGNMISTTNPLDQTFVFSYDNVTGNILSETDFNGLKTRYFYDSFENLRQTIFPDNTVVYNENNWNTDNTTYPNSIFYKKQTNIDGAYSITHFDRLGRGIFSISNSFNGNDIVSKVLYNEKGQKYKIFEPYYMGQTPDKFTEYSYYIDGRLKKVAAPTNVVENIYNDAELLTTTKVYDKNNTFLKSYSSKIDKSGYVIQKTDAGGTINYTYYASGLIEKTTYLSSEIVLEYDFHGNKTSITDPDAGTSYFTYDAWGNLLSQTNANGYTTTMNYDILGRVETIQADEGIINYHYNQQGRLYNIFDEGTGYSKTFTYDDLGRLLTSTENIDNQNFAYSYTYDNLGRTKTVTYPSGFSIKNIYNNNGFLQQIVNNDNNNLIWQLNEMNQFGQITQTQFGSGKTTTYGYDEFHLPQSVYSPDIVNREYLFEP